MPPKQLLVDWLYALFAGIVLGGLFLALEASAHSLPGGVSVLDQVLFCVMIGLGFAVAAMSLVWWENRKRDMSVSTLTSPAWMLAEWVATTLWTVLVLALPLSGAAFFYSGDWPVLLMVVVFTPLSALLTAFFVSRNRWTEEGEGVKET